MVIEVGLTGRIDELDTINTPELLAQYINEVRDPMDSNDEATPFELARANLVFAALGLRGQYTVNGIEGQGIYYKGAGLPLGDSFIIDIEPHATAFDIMQRAWEVTEAHAWPHVDYVWFELMEVDTNTHIITFHMGS